MKYKVGDKFIIEVKEAIESEKGTLYRADFSTLVFDDYGLDKLPKYCEVQERLELIDELKQVEYSKGLNDGRNDAWELATRISSKSIDALVEMFDTDNKYLIFRDFSPQEALAKLKAYEDSKIEVGDVVEITHYDEKFKGLVLDILDEISFVLLTENGMVESYVDENVKKTGKRIDITSILEQISEV